MTFEGQYLTKDEYIALGGNPDIGDMPFNLLEFEARKQIDSRTLNRLKNGKNIPQEVKLCEYALINSINEFAKSTSNVASNGNVASENTDGYSISYITSDKISDIVNSKQDEINNIIETYLMFVVYNGEHLMYCGV
jgi:hypothetical protein